MGSSTSEAPPLPATIAHRYEVLGELGRGGAAVVYRVREAGTGRELALKQLSFDRIGKHTRELAVLFQREFHTLAQLSHPRIIQVFDFGVSERGPYYTMELLDGGDLKARSPIPYREACRLLYDVCSSLALVHSRRWVHRDVTPVNIRCTRDGRAKLIDFGAMVPMGLAELSVGTPPFTAPEVLQHSLLDARTDLFSLGATLYYVLTGKNAYPARSFAQLPLLWREPPSPPSHHVESPPRLDALVLSLLRPDSAARPSSAFEVMQRLAAIADIEAESESVSLAYLATPNLVGRESALKVFDQALESAKLRGGKSLLVRAESGLGRTRLLDACVLAAKIAGALVLRAGASRGADFAVAQELMGSLLEREREAFLATCVSLPGSAEFLLEPRSEGTNEAPRLKDLSDASLPRMETHALLASWLSQFARVRTLVVIVDDLERVDEPSIVLLAALANVTQRRRMVILASVAAGSVPAASNPAIAALESRSQNVSLPALDTDQIRELFRSVFGEVENLSLLSDNLQRVSAGAPRVAMELAQRMVDQGRIRYRDGHWTLPETVDAFDLPQSLEDALQKRLSELSPLARSLCEVQVLASHPALSREDFARVFPAEPPAEVDRALAELLSSRLLSSNGAIYNLAHAGLARAVTAALSPALRKEAHRALVPLYADSRGADVIWHLLESDQGAAAAARALALVENEADTLPIQRASRMTTAEVASVFVAALAEAERLGYRPRALSDLRRAIVSFSTAGDDAHFHKTAPTWRAQLARDSGLDHFQASADVHDLKLRVQTALARAQADYLATPETERVYTVPEAIRGLLAYAVASIVIGGRTQNFALLESLPPLLAPFAGTSPMVYAIWQNCLAMCESTCRAQEDTARVRWIEVYDRLSQLSGDELQRVELVRNAIAFGIAFMSAQLGLSSANEWVERIERDPRQHVNGLYLRRVTALQQGDWDEAEQWRKRAELASLQAATRQMFNSSAADLLAHIMAQDLAGVTQSAARLAALSERTPGWRPQYRCATGYAELLRGDLAGARATFEACVRACTPGGEAQQGAVGMWLLSTTGLLETLLAQDALEEARSLGTRAVAMCKERGIHASSFPVERALALAEARLGAAEAARQRIDAVIAAQETLGVSGLQLGVSYETRARVALLDEASDEIAKYAELAAREYRHGLGSPLGARYERLMEDARRFVPRPLMGLGEFSWVSTSSATIHSLVTRALRPEHGRVERARAALETLCQLSGASAGHLYLCDGEQLAHGASVDAEALPALPQAALEYLQRYAIETEVTATVTGDDAASLRVGEHVYQVALLQHRSQERVICVGILLLLKAPERELARPDSAILEAFSARFVARGSDADGSDTTR